MQPVAVWDTARICVEFGESDRDLVVDAAGPERWAFLDFVRLIGRSIGGRAWIRTAPLPVARALGKVAGLGLRDVVATRDELEALDAGLLVSREPPLGRDRFDDWLVEHAATLGRGYASELARNFRGQDAP